MKRLLVLTSLSLAAVFGVVSFAEGQIFITRVSPQSFTSSTSPHRDRTRPYTFTTSGKLTPPPACTTIGATGCVPLVCPRGTTLAKYCTTVPTSLLCIGAVTVQIKKRFTTISSRTARVQPDCTYRSRVSFRTHSRTRHGLLRVLVRFQGNIFLLPAHTPVRTVIAG